MKTITIEKNVYEYSELSEQAKEEAKNFLLEGREPYIFSSDVKEDFRCQYGFELTPQYSLNYCQGDGFSLYGEVYFSDFIKNNELKKIAMDGLRGFQRGIAEKLINKVVFTRGHRYCYASRNDVELEEEAYTDKGNAIVEKVRENIASWYLDVCGKYEEWGYSYFYEITDEQAQDECDCNQYTFFEDGKVCHSVSSIAV